MACDKCEAFLKGLSDKFETHPIRVSEGRAQKQMIPELVTIFEEHVKVMVEDIKVVKLDDSMNASSALTPYLFAIAPKREFYVTEHMGLASFRLLLRGTRACVCTRLSHLGTFTAAMPGEKKAEEISPQAALKFLKAITSALMKDYASKFEIFHTTSGPGDVFYTPAGMVVVELIQNNV